MIAVTDGILFLIKAGKHSGGYVLRTVVTFLAIFPMVAYPRFAPWIFGAVASARFFATGLKYRLRSLRPAEELPIAWPSAAARPGRELQRAVRLITEPPPAP